MPAADAPAAAVLAFGEFTLDVAQARLTRAGRELPLSRKPFALLAELAGRPGELLSKDHLLDEVWGRRFVSDSAVKSVLSELRAALGDDARAPRWIETVQARGYRFVGEVKTLSREPRMPAAGGAARGNLPQVPPVLIGRDAELARLLPQVGAELPPLLTFTGPAGVGKSRFALRLACEWRAVFADGAWRIDLAGLPAAAEPALLRATLAQALRLSDAAARDAGALAGSLEGLRMLLLDNAVHLAAELAPLLQLLLDRGAGLRWLLTSREPLRLGAEQLLHVAPLAVPAPDDEADPGRVLASGAAQLFVHRVRAPVPEFSCGAADAPPLAQLCRMLGGLPLAPELAAARVPTLGLTGLCERLAQGHAGAAAGSSVVPLQLLGAPARVQEPRYRGLREALDWSHVLLSAVEQKALRRLSVLQGAFGLATAQAVSAGPDVDEWQGLDALQALVESSWVGASQGEPRRFQLLHSVRAYARERLVDAGEAPAARRAHFEAQRAYWQASDARALGDPALRWVQEHVEALSDLRAALAWGCDAVCTSPPALSSGERLALHERRPDCAALLLWRFDAPGRTGSEFGPGTFIRRSVATLWARLRAEAGDALIADRRTAAEQVSDGEALRKLLA